MLTFITGLPGASKTCFTLSRIFKIYKDRQIYTFNIEGIDHDYFGTIPIDDVDMWYTLPHGAVIVVDEAQGFFPIRKTGAAVPRKCSEFETHRHNGFDVVLITQDASLLDNHVRKLAGKHYHIKRLFGTESANVFEYDQFEPKPVAPSTIKKATASSVWKFDKTVYEHYHSAEVHTVKRRIPPKLILVPIMIIFSMVAIFFVFKTVKNLVTDDVEEVTIALESVDGDTVATFLHNPVKEWAAARKPLIAGMPWTQPRYLDLQEAKSFPKPHCVIIQSHNRTRCRCYSQQVTLMPGVSNSICNQFAIQGWFDSTREDSSGEDRAQRGRPEIATVERIRSGGVPAGKYSGRVPVVKQKYQ